MLQGFLVRRFPKRGIQVELVRRCGAFRGCVPGTMVTLDENDLAEVESTLAIKNGDVEV